VNHHSPEDGHAFFDAATRFVSLANELAEQRE